MRRAPTGAGSVYRRTDGRWEAAAYVTTTAGNRKRLRVYADSQRDARMKLADIVRREYQGIPAPDRRWTIGDYLDYWITDVAPASRAPRTIEMYQAVIRCHLRPDLGSYPLTQLSVPQLQMIFNRQLAAGRSMRSVQITRTVLSAALTRAMREELVMRNVARLVELPTADREEVVPWTEQEASRFLNAARTHRLYGVFLLLTLYGMRRGEVLGLRWQDVDFEEGVLRVRQQLQRIGEDMVTGRLKTKASRRDLPLLPFVATVLQRHQASQGRQVALPDPGDHRDLVFRGVTGQPIDPKNFGRTFHLLRDQAGLRRITVHQLRHTAATLLKRHGVQPRDAQLILGHANVITTQQIYQHGDPERQREALAGVGRLLNAGRVRTRSRQLQPSNSFFIAKLTTSISGGPSETRTQDTLLKSRKDDPLVSALTGKWMLARARYRMAVLGCAAVTGAVGLNDE